MQTNLAPRTLRAGAYRLDPARSTVRFTAYHFWGVKPVAGTFPLRTGSVLVGSDPGHGTVTAELDAAGFRTDDPRRDKDVTGRRFLDAAAHPTIAFHGSAAGDRLTGTLTVRGVASPLTLTVTGAEQLPDGWRFTATGRVDRVAAGVRTGRGIIHRYLDVELDVVAAAGPR